MPCYIVSCYAKTTREVAFKDVSWACHQYRGDVRLPFGLAPVHVNHSLANCQLVDLQRGWKMTIPLEQ